MMRFGGLVVVTAAVLVACGGGDGGPDWEGYADYMTHRSSRGTPIAAKEVERLMGGDRNCGETSLEFFWAASADEGTEARDTTANVYFTCGAEGARTMVRSQTAGAVERALLEFIDEDLPTYGN